jgi:hypothetical protein
VHGVVGQNDPYKLSDFLSALTPLGAPAEQRRIGIDITLLRFGDPAAG